MQQTAIITPEDERDRDQMFALYQERGPQTESDLISAGIGKDSQRRNVATVAERNSACRSMGKRLWSISSCGPTNSASSLAIKKSTTFAAIVFTRGLILITWSLSVVRQTPAVVSRQSGRSRHELPPHEDAWRQRGHGLRQQIYTWCSNNDFRCDGWAAEYDDAVCRRFFAEAEPSRVDRRKCLRIMKAATDRTCGNNVDSLP